jgi:hypothetical protein
MMADETVQRSMDAEEHRKTYQAVMKASAEVGVPFCLALTMFFTNLVLANGVWTAIVAGIVTYIAVYIIVRLFFSH